MSVPLDDNGKPMVKVRNGAEELIPTVQYGNIKIGPASVEKWVKDTPEDINQGLYECLVRCEAVLGENREQILEKIKSAGLR